MATKRVVPISKAKDAKDNKALKPEKELFTTCASCKFCISDGDKYKEEFYCFLNPPTVLNDEDGLFSARPLIESTDHICSHFYGKQ